MDIITGTLGKALGGASGGYTSGRKEIVELLRQRSRPYLFSNSVAPPIVAASLKVLELLTESGDLRKQLRENTRFFRERMTEAGFNILPGEHPIVPVMFGDAGRGFAHGRTAADQRRLCGCVFLPRGAAGQGAHPHADLRRAHPRRPRIRARKVCRSEKGIGNLTYPGCDGLSQGRIL